MTDRRPITHAELLTNGHLILNVVGGRKHIASPDCWCGPFEGFRGYFEDIQGEPNRTVLVHSNFHALDDLKKARKT